MRYITGILMRNYTGNNIAKKVNIMIVFFHINVMKCVWYDNVEWQFVVSAADINVWWSPWQTPQTLLQSPQCATGPHTVQSSKS